MDATASAKFAPLLAGSHLLGWLPPDCLRAIAVECIVRSFQPGDDLFRRGTPLDHWILLLQGTARCTDVPPEARRPAMASDGHTFGARILLDSDRETTSAADGRFRFDNVLGGEHLATLDLRSLGGGERPATDPERLFLLFDGSSEEVHFLLYGPPVLTLTLERIPPGMTEVAVGQ